MSAFPTVGDSYRTLFERHPQPMWVYDLETLRFLAVNEAAVHRYGYSRDEFLRMTLADIRPPDQVSALMENVKQERQAIQKSGVWRHRTKDGAILRIEIASHTLVFDGREAALVMATDVGKRLVAEEALADVQAQQLRRYSRLLNLMRSPEFARGDEDFVLRSVTRMVSEIIGVERVSVWRYTSDRDAIVARVLFEASDDRHSEGLRLDEESYPSYFRALETEEVIVADDAPTDPRTREFAEHYLTPTGITSMLDAPIFGEGGVEGVLCLEHVGAPRSWTAIERSFAVSAANAVSLLLAQVAHTRSEERFRLLSRATNDAIWDWDLETDRLWWNEGFETLFGFKRDEIEGTIESWTTRIHAEDREDVVADIYLAIEEGRTAWSREYRFLRRDGGYAWVRDRGHVIRDGEGKAVRMVGGMTDLTDRRELERQLRESQKLESIGRLAGGVAHDFNNLLTVIRGVVDLHLDGEGVEGLPELLVTDLREIREAAERATRLTRQLLAFSRRQVLEPRVVDLNETVGGMQKILRRLIGEDVTMVFEPKPGPLPVRADPTGIEQVLVNLVVNSRDAMPTGGDIALEIGTVASDDVPGGGKGADPSSPWVCLEVRDTGTGMEEETLARCMEPFFTRKPDGKGTGLGLSTVYGIVRQTGGHISLSSEVGRGTTVRVFLPLSPEAAESIPDEGPGPGSKGGAETVLLVEDEPAVRRLAARILSMAGYRVMPASGGEEAMAIARETPPHLLVTDVVMPGMSGPELAKRLSEKDPGIRVLFTSGYTADAMDRHGVPSEGAHFLPKPYTVEELTARVREVLDRDGR